MLVQAPALEGKGGGTGLGPHPLPTSIWVLSWGDGGRQEGGSLRQVSAGSQLRPSSGEDATPSHTRWDRVD